MADDRQDLLNAINSFLDCSIVLPPSEMGSDELLRSVARFQREMLRKRDEQGGKLAKEPKSHEEKGDESHRLWPYRRKPPPLSYDFLLMSIITCSFPSHRGPPHAHEKVRRPLGAHQAPLWGACTRRAAPLPKVPQ